MSNHILQGNFIQKIKDKMERDRERATVTCNNAEIRIVGACSIEANDVGMVNIPEATSDLF
jgi:hypothetical protein